MIRTVTLSIFWADSRGKTIAVLTVLAASFFTAQFRLDFLIHIFIALLLSMVIDWLLVRVKTQKNSFSLSSVVTGLLIGLVFDPLSGVLPTAVACLVASLSKSFLGKASHRHIFNPAALGILASSLIFNRPVAWWGASWGMVPVAIIGLGMFPILRRIRREWMAITFLLIYMIFTSPRLAFDGTVFLFAFVLLTEPKTSSIAGKWRWGWGILVGLLVFIQSLFGIAIADPLLFALLTANIIRYILIR